MFNKGRLHNISYTEVYKKLFNRPNQKNTILTKKFNRCMGYDCVTVISGQEN